MQAQTRRKTAAGEETVLAFKRHILQESSAFASEPMADLFRVSILAQMLDRYDALAGRGMREAACCSRVLHEFTNIADMMREQGFTQENDRAEAQDASRWPLLSEGDFEQYLQENDDYMHRQAFGVGLCSSCVTPLMIGAALADILYSDAAVMLGLAGMFAMIGMGVYAIVTAAKPKKHREIKKGRFSLSARVRRKLEQISGELESKIRRRKGKGVLMLVTCLIPLFLGTMITEVTYADGWVIMGLAGMFLMIGAGVYELVMADSEKKTLNRLLRKAEK